eukprot:747602-Hanusia_phi.AAC.1
MNNLPACFAYILSQAVCASVSRGLARRHIATYQPGAMKSMVKEQATMELMGKYGHGSAKC